MTPTANLPPLPTQGRATTVGRLPDKLTDPTLLVGWSLSQRHSTKAIGFSYGARDQVPATGFVDPIQLAREGHLITIAPTGAGKGRGCIVPALLQHDGPVIVIDPKGENVAITARRRRELGQTVIVLDPMRITNEPGAAFNPLDLIDIESAIAVDDAAAIAGGLWAGPSDPRDRFWMGRAQQVTLGLLLHLLADHPPETRNFAGLRALVAKAIGDPSAMVATLAESRHPEARLVATALKVPATETLSGILAFAQEMVDFLRGPLVAESTAASTFDVHGITRGDPLSIYIVMPPHMLESHGRLLRVWISSLMGAISQRRAKPAKSTLFILDEAAQLGTLPQLRQAITLMRGYGLQTWSFWQDVSQLQMLYPHDWQTMINNCRVVQCFGALTMNAAAGMAGLTGATSGEFVLDLEPDEVLLQLAGDSPIVAQLPDYLRDPPFAGHFDPNPYYLDPSLVRPQPRPRIELKSPEPPRPTKLEESPSRARRSARAADARDALHDRLMEMWEDDKAKQADRPDKADDALE